MPLYEYQCKDCGTKVEIRHGFREQPVAKCEQCGGELRRVFTPAGIVFKGSGFYVTDSRAKKTGGEPSKPGESTATDAAAGSSESTSAKTDSPSSASTSEGSKKPDGDKPPKKKRGSPSGEAAA